MKWIAGVATAAALFFGLADAQVRGSTFKPARPPDIPLAVRSPYLNVWQQAGSDGGNGGYLAGQWPTFWQGSIMGWTGLIRVDNLTYTWMGKPILSEQLTPPLVNQTSFEYTATRSIFTMDVGGYVKMVITFFSPVTPTDLTRAAFPMSYMNVDVSSLDGKDHKVEVYTDITAEWISGNRDNIAQWDYGTINSGKPPANQFNVAGAADNGDMDAQIAIARPDGSYTTFATDTSFPEPTGPVTHTTPPVAATTPHLDPIPPVSPSRASTTFAAFASPSPSSTGGYAYHKIFRQVPQDFSEVADQTEYGNWYYMTDNTADLTHQSGSDIDVRGAFEKNGYLRNRQDRNYRAINDQYPTFGYAVTFGTVGKTVKSHKWAVALAQSDAVQFLGKGRITRPLQSLWKAYFPSDEDALNFYFGDYQMASTLGDGIDKQIQTDSSAAAGQTYATITTLATRQAFGSLEFANSAGQPLIFMKEISSDGNTNTVDVIFPFHVMALYLNPNLLRMLLDPLFINQEAGNWPRAYSIHDIGSSFPNATGHPDGNAEAQPLEECGNMILMALAYTQRTGDKSYLTKHYSILRQWVNYLVELTLIPEDQLSTDDFAGSLPNVTNLAVKGIVGIGAMAQIADLTGNTKDSNNYTRISQRYIKRWQNLGINKRANPPHSTLQYGNGSSYSLLYNIYPDKLLGLGLVPQSVFDMQSTFYKTKFNRYGVPLDERHDYTKADWEIYCAAVAAKDTQQRFVDALALFINETPTQFPFSDLYRTTNADFPLPPAPRFINRPPIGGTFAILALNGAPKAPSSRREIGDQGIAGRLEWEGA